MSPVWYQDRAHGGAFGSFLELSIVAGASVVLWRRYPSRLLRGALVALNGASLVGWLRFYASALL